MTYYISKTITETSFESALEKVTDLLKTYNFGVITEIDMKNTLKEKLDVSFRNYRILGACNPKYAYGALQADDKIGTILPCNVVVQEMDNGSIEVDAMDPVAIMGQADNTEVEYLAWEVKNDLQKVFDQL